MKQYKRYFTLEEDLRLSDFTKHSGVSDFTKTFMKDRQKIRGAGNKSAKLKSIKINRKKDYITVIFRSVPTYSSSADAVAFPNVEASKKVKAYTQEIRLMDFFKWAETKPGYVEAELTWEEIKEIISVCSIKVACNCFSYQFQGINYVDTVMDAAIYPELRAPKRWNAYHHDDSFACKHLDILFTSGLNLYVQNTTSMINKYLKGNKL